MSRRLSVTTALFWALLLSLLAMIAISGSQADARSDATHIPNDKSSITSAKIKPRTIQVGQVSSVRNIRWKVWRKNKAVGRGIHHACRLTTTYPGIKCKKFRVKIRAKGRCWSQDAVKFVFGLVKIRASRSTAASRKAGLPLTMDWRSQCRAVHGALGV